ncbi:hypothetical protein CLV90_2766 [Maribacter spongiicola]|uniref:Helix-turn-helix protein n=1 Tax=Maribacter spongiicola TaxID=1206753 RepID=A0A4R7K059_9FLAO|nr:hypothetical protein CLV90_2766 [Maribacter spongiicola]
MKHLADIGNIRIINAPYSQKQKPDAPKRKSLELQSPNFGFVKPVQQDFVRNPRLMPMTRCMVLMLLGWAGQEQPLETTMGIIAKKLGRSVRQVQRYLKDAIEEGYLFYSRTKNRWGYYTGIKIHLNFLALKPTKPKKRRKQATTHTADTNNNYKYKRKNTPQETEFLNKLNLLAVRNGITLAPD